MFRWALKVVVQVIVWLLLLIDICYFSFYVRGQYQREVDGWEWVMEGHGWKKSLSLHYLIILLQLPTNWICFCPQGFLAEKTRKSLSYLELGVQWQTNNNSPRIDCVFFTLFLQVRLCRRMYVTNYHKENAEEDNT